jgi:2-C-methyl-D-erythritol 4-phosphate cytidylyltransferase
LGHDKSITAIAGRPVLAYGLEALLGIRDIEKVVVAVRADVKEEAKVWIGKNYPNEAKRVEVIVGGKERQDSVWEGLGALGGGAEWAVVQDAARVLTTAGLIERVMAGAKRSGAAAAARKMSDTVREADRQGNVLRLLDREGLWRMETPQVVRGTILRQGLQKARAEGKTVTDCMAAAELAGVKGILVEATEPNLKITLPSDWQLAEVWLKAGSK